MLESAAARSTSSLQINGRTEEVRLAMAWNGGVSLAVWMGGVAAELDAARRAHLGAGAADPGRTIYAALCRALNRILVIDILTGASAGGINGALLGAVITHTRRLDAGYLRNRWIALGNFSDLLRPTNANAPPSLMDGKYFAREVLRTFHDCLGEGSDSQAAALGELELSPSDYLPAEVLLDVQSTNVFGLQRGIPDHWGEFFYAREYRAPIRFRGPEDYTAEALATAARASASFPAAFEPAEINDQAAALAGYEGKTRWGIDGGLLENAPIEAAIELIPRRSADRRVRRFVCYINADPPGKAPVPDEPSMPDLQAVLGYTVNLPRDGRVIDELIAIENAFRRGEAAGDALPPLAKLPHECLAQTAEALLDAYRRQRALGSLEQITAEPGLPPRPGLARAIFNRLDAADNLSLPWVPPAGGLEVSLDDWRWGIRAAQRVLFLELDLLRLEGSPDRLVETRGPIDSAIHALDTVAERLRSTGSVREATSELRDAPDLDAHLNALDGLFDEFRAEIREPLESATNAFLEAIDPPLSASLLDGMVARGMDPATFFIWRALAVEVIRRAFVADHEIDTAQTLRFAQITPVVPCPVMTATPFSDRGPDSARDKLTGIDLGHFAGFYRASWRANDFMWGRLDGAARIVDLLLDGAQPDDQASSNLAAALVPLDDDPDAVDRRNLVREALLDTSAGYGGVPPESPSGLRELVAELVAADLGVDGAKLTRVLCARAAQYECLRDEIPVLVEQTAADSKLDCFTEPIKLESETTFEQIRELRVSVESPKPLPERLGRGSRDELTSTLALRTVSHATLVALATARSLRVPIGKIIDPVRLPFLSVAGLTSRGWGKRAAAGAAYAGAGAYITARLLTSQAGEGTQLNTVTSLATIVLWIAALAVVAFVAVPAWRAWRSEQVIRRLGQGAWTAGLLAAGGGVIVFWAFVELGTWETLTASTGQTPPEWMLWFVLAVLGPVAILVRKLPALGPVQTPMGWAAERLDTGGVLTALVVLGASAILYAWSVSTLWDAARDENSSGWDWIGLVLVVVATLLGFTYALFQRWRGRGQPLSSLSSQ
jgi:predicted acylesterase/phospholipase RssA